MTTATMREIPGITSPITHAGRVVYNARRDFLETRRRRTLRGSVRVYDNDEFGDVECHSIQPYELCFRSDIERYQNFKPNDTDFSVFSSANGIILSSSDAQIPLAGGAGFREATAQEREDTMMSKLTFAGVACNRALYDPSNHANEEGLAVQVGGLQTIYNSGSNIIFAGDIVLYGKPLSASGTGFNRRQNRTRIPGIPHSKMIFSVERYDPEIAVGGGGAANWDEYKRHMHRIQKRVIGKAMSTAKPGQPFDILLGHYCM